MLRVKIMVMLLVAVVLSSYIASLVIADDTMSLDKSIERHENREASNREASSGTLLSQEQLSQGYSNQPVARVYVKKSERKMYLLDADDEVIRQYHIALGDAPQGHKQQEGDERTPEGEYTLDYKNENSIAHRSIHISYPNSQDKANAYKMGVSPGGAIMIHGQMNGYEKFTALNQQRDWTDGCVAVTNDEMDEIMALVKVGTPIKIEW